jgi:hypothetical protein
MDIVAPELQRDGAASGSDPAGAATSLLALQPLGAARSGRVVAHVDLDAFYCQGTAWVCEEKAPIAL